MRNRARRRRTNPQRQDIDALAQRFLVSDEAACPCDGCGGARRYNIPVCAEYDPYLITFWVSLCERCLAEDRRGQLAVRKVKARGWARPGVIPNEDEMPPRDDFRLGAMLEQARG